MAKLSTLHSVYLDEVKYLISLSHTFLLNGGKGLKGDNKEAGDLCEKFIKDLLERFLPKRFRVVSGYIATAENLEKDEDLPQCDCIIVDAFIPSIAKYDKTDIEIVPAEAVCGIIEIKRSLNKKSLTEALEHLRKIVETAKITKTNPNEYFLGKPTTSTKTVDLSGGFKNNPLIGIISLQNKFTKNKEFTKKKRTKEEIKNSLSFNNDNLLDFIWTLDGFSLKTGKPNESNPEKPHIDPQLWVRENNNTHKLWATDPCEDDEITVFSRMIGFILVYLSNIAGRQLENETFEGFFIENIKK
jgi:hypothetical protein